MTPPARPLLALLVALVIAACGATPAEARKKKRSSDDGKGLRIELTDRTVSLSGGIAEPLIKKAQKQMLELDEQSHEPIWVLINSGGGSVEAGLVLIDTMRAIESPTHCLVESKAYSMAAITLAFCDKRYALPHATIMLHEASYGTAGEDPSNRARLDFLARYLDGLHVEIARRLGMKTEVYRAKIRDAWWLLASEALTAGVVEGIPTRIDFVKLPVARTEAKTTRALQVTTQDAVPAADTIPKRRD